MLGKEGQKISSLYRPLLYQLPFGKKVGQKKKTRRSLLNRPPKSELPLFLLRLFSLELPIPTIFVLSLLLFPHPLHQEERGRKERGEEEGRSC